VNVDGPDLSPHRRMFERRIGNQRDLLAWLGVAKATTQRLALAGGGERTHLVAVAVRTGRADDVKADGDRSRARAGCSCGGRTCRAFVCSLPRWARSEPPIKREGAGDCEVELSPVAPARSARHCGSGPAIRVRVAAVASSTRRVLIDWDWGAHGIWTILSAEEISAPPQGGRWLQPIP
jgi:hypothetical protein